MRRHYKKKISGFEDWNQKEHCQEYLFYTKNMGEYLSLDETSLSQGELYTYLTNKEAKGRKGQAKRIKILGISQSRKSLVLS